MYSLRALYKIFSYLLTLYLRERFEHLFEGGLLMIFFWTRYERDFVFFFSYLLVIYIIIAIIFFSGFFLFFFLLATLGRLSGLFMECIKCFPYSLTLIMLATLDTLFELFMECIKCFSYLLTLIFFSSWLRYAGDTLLEYAEWVF